MLFLSPLTFLFVQDALIASYTSVSTSPPGTGGIKMPNQRWLTVSNVTFANFDTPQQACIRACSHCKVLQGGFMYSFEKLTFLGKSTDHRVSFQWEHEVRTMLLVLAWLMILIIPVIKMRISFYCAFFLVFLFTFFLPFIKCYLPIYCAILHRH